jgi:SAM-dependent methyltransferase
MRVSEDVSDENVGVFTWQPHADTTPENFVALVRRQADRAEAFPPHCLLNQIDLNGKTVVELGCGAGAKSLPFVLRGASLIGIDGSPVQVQRAREHAKLLGVEDTTKFVQGRLENLDKIREEAGIAKADIIINNANIHHVEGWRSVVAGYSGALKDDGYVYLGWGDPTLSWGSFNLKNQIAYRLGNNRESRLRIGRFLFGWWDRRRNVMNLNWDSFFADLYSAYYIPITVGQMKKALRDGGMEVVQSFPPLDVDQWLAIASPSATKKLLARIVSFASAVKPLLSFLVRLRHFFRFRHGPRVLVCRKLS